MHLDIGHEVAALRRLTVGQLRQRFAEVYGEATTASNRTWLIKRIAWRLQALAEGDRSERARRRAEELANEDGEGPGRGCERVQGGGLRGTEGAGRRGAWRTP